MEKKKSMSRVERLHREKVTRYSIRKVSFGAASVAVAALFMFLGNGAVAAAEQGVSSTNGETQAQQPKDQNAQNGTYEGNTVSTSPAATVETNTQPSTIENSPSPESAPQKVETLDKKELTDLIKEIDGKFAKVILRLADGAEVTVKVPVRVVSPQNGDSKPDTSLPNHGANNGTTNTDVKVDKAKLEGAIRQLDELIIKESAKLDEETAKEANDLLADAKKVFVNADANQAEVDAMVKRIEDFMAKVAPSTDHATPANDQAAQTPAVAPATTQAAANASQTASAQVNTRTVAKELPNTGTADSVVSMVAAAASAVLGLGLAGRRRKEDEEA